jgi:hypothetical protein
VRVPRGGAPAARSGVVALCCWRCCARSEPPCLVLRTPLPRHRCAHQSMGTAHRRAARAPSQTPPARRRPTSPPGATLGLTRRASAAW